MLKFYLVIAFLKLMELINPIDSFINYQSAKCCNSDFKIEIIDSIILDGYIVKITKTIPKQKNEKFHLDKRIILFFRDSILSFSNNPIDSLILKSEYLILTRYELNNLIIDNSFSHLFPILPTKCDSVLIPNSENYVKRKIQGDFFKISWFRMKGEFYILNIYQPLFKGKRWWLKNQNEDLNGIIVLVPKWR
jgi:hypothetical protein